MRLYAYRALVANHDQVALNLLVDSLRRGQNVPIPLPDAIELLDYDGAANYIGVLRPYLGIPRSAVQARAARALALDPESRPKIVELARNPGSPEEVRLNALRGLAREDGRFASYAIPIVEDPRRTPTSATPRCTTSPAGMNYATVDPADQVRFAQAVEKLAGEQRLATSERWAEVREGARQLHALSQAGLPGDQEAL